jgi:hypothetical protein
MIRTILICVLAAASLRADSLYYTVLDTSGLAGDNGYLVFDFISGGGPANALSISDFTTDGTVGASSTTGTVVPIANPPYVIPTELFIDDPVSSVFNEYQVAFTFDSTIAFFLDGSENAPGPGNSPDELSIFFLASDDATSLITTSDPTLADTLLTLDLDGSANGVPTVYSVSAPLGVSATATLNGGPSGPPPSSPVPEPSSLWLIALAMCLVGLTKLRLRSPRRASPSSRVI